MAVCSGSMNAKNQSLFQAADCFSLYRLRNDVKKVTGFTTGIPHADTAPNAPGSIQSCAPNPHQRKLPVASPDCLAPGNDPIAAAVLRRVNSLLQISPVGRISRSVPYRPKHEYQTPRVNYASSLGEPSLRGPPLSTPYSDTAYW